MEASGETAFVEGFPFCEVILKTFARFNLPVERAEEVLEKASRDF
jgi:hypothetical protein